MKQKPIAPQHEQSELELLAQRFVQLAAAPYEVPMPVGGDGRDILQAVLCEINETMLPRRLSLVADTNARLTLLMSNRRLLAIETEGQIDDPKQLMPKDVARHFATLLNRFIVEAKVVTLSRPVPLDGYASADLSVSAALLGDALGLTTRQDAADSETACLSSNLQEAAVAWTEATSDLHFGDARGPESQLQMLKDVWTAYIGSQAKGGGQRIQKLTKQYICLPLGSQDCLVFLTEDEKQWVLAVMSQARFQACVRHLV